MRLLSRSLEHGPAFLTRNRTGEVAALATRGVDALDAWFSRFLPQMVLSTTVPLAVITMLATVDLLSAVVVACTVPLIPVFMVLVGQHTRSRTEQSWAVLQALAGHFLDTVRGMPTLRVYGRAKAQERSVRVVTDEQRVTTMAALRVAFSSALVLELLATLSVALVAVEIGLRLVHGSIAYEPALLVLLLAPEAYLPLRRVGAEYHASQEGACSIPQGVRPAGRARRRTPPRRSPRAGGDALRAGPPAGEPPDAGAAGPLAAGPARGVPLPEPWRDHGVDGTQRVRQEHPAGRPRRPAEP
jgi:ATP-binding cassette subfamily C protein CydD